MKGKLNHEKCNLRSGTITGGRSDEIVVLGLLFRPNLADNWRSISGNLMHKGVLHHDKRYEGDQYSS